MIVAAYRVRRAWIGASHMRSLATRVTRAISSSSEKTGSGRWRRQIMDEFSARLNLKGWSSSHPIMIYSFSISRQLQHIYENSLGDYPGVGVLTASNRDVWAKVRLLKISWMQLNNPRRIIRTCRLLLITLRSSMISTPLRL